MIQRRRLLRRKVDYLVAYAQHYRGTACVAGFVAFTRRSDREGGDIGAALGDSPTNEARIDATAEQCPNGDVRIETHCHGFIEALLGFFNGLFEKDRGGTTFFSP